MPPRARSSPNATLAKAVEDQHHIAAPLSPLTTDRHRVVEIAACTVRALRNIGPVVEQHCQQAGMAGRQEVERCVEMRPGVDSVALVNGGQAPPVACPGLGAQVPGRSRQFQALQGEASVSSASPCMNAS